MDEDSLLRESLSWAVKLVNKRIDVEALKKKYFPNEDRTLMIKILGKSADTGIVLDTVTKEIMLTSPENMSKVTVTAIMNEDTFWLCMMGKVTIAECFFDRMHPIALEGDATLRDMKIFIAMEEEFRKVFEDVWRGGEKQ